MDVHLVNQANDTAYRKARILSRALTLCGGKTADAAHCVKELMEGASADGSKHYLQFGESHFNWIDIL